MNFNEAEQWRFNPFDVTKVSNLINGLKKRIPKFFRQIRIYNSLSPEGFQIASFHTKNKADFEI